MEVRESEKNRIKRALKRVDAIKKFYQHLSIYLLINILLLFVKYQVLEYLMAEGIQDPGFLDWFQWNFFATPFLWGIGLLIHGIYVFKFNARPLKELKPKFIKDWEQRQLQKFLDEENHDRDKFQ